MCEYNYFCSFLFLYLIECIYYYVHFPYLHRFSLNLYFLIWYMFFRTTGPHKSIILICNKGAACYLHVNVIDEVMEQQQIFYDESMRVQHRKFKIGF